MKTFFLAAASLASLFSLSIAQLDPNDVSKSDRTYWCDSQTTQCPLICTQETNGSAATESNTCDPDTLQYSCVCSNGISPNASEYSQTIPYFECTESNNICVQNCGLNNNACASACREDNLCGAQNPTRINATTVSTTTTATNTGNAAQKTDSSGDIVYNGYSGSSATPSAGVSGKSAASRMAAAGELYGLSVIATGLFVGFTLLV